MELPEVSPERSPSTRLSSTPGLLDIHPTGWAQTETISTCWGHLAAALARGGGQTGGLIKRDARPHGRLHVGASVSIPYILGSYLAHRIPEAFLRRRGHAAVPPREVHVPIVEVLGDRHFEGKAVEEAQDRADWHRALGVAHRPLDVGIAHRET